jgi:hypothetical protein
MPMHHQRSSHAVRGQRRKLVWATLDQSVTMAGGAGSNLNLLASLSVAGASLLGITIMRTHLDLWRTGQVSALADSLRLGLIVDRVAAVGAGPPAGAVTAADGEADWILWRHEFAAPTFGATGGSNYLVYDVRAKRKMQELDQAYLLCLFNAAGGAQTWSISGRILVALP